MSKQIDERVLKMEFDNQQFESGVKTSMSTLDKLKHALKMDGAEKALSNVSAAAKKVDVSPLGGAVDTIKAKFSALDVIAVTALANITNSALNTGKQLIKSLSTDQIAAGWNKYEQKTASVQTLVNSTGKSVQEINGYLDKLMWFSDETSYGFTDMTAALGQMTSSGGKIDKLIPLITGVANATAYAGKGATEFSRVMYNLNQSYGAGALTLMDWKSVELAGVGSKQLKEELIKAGEELGKINKGTVTLGNFTETLKDKWADTEVMERAFGKFSEMSEKAYELVESGQYETASEAIEALSGQYGELAERAFKSAQEAKSFTEAIDATKDAVSSGWMETFDIIFGNYEEAKTLWTDLANALWDVFASGAEARNDLLREWKELGGRDDLIESFWNTWEAAGKIIAPIKEAFRDIFPETTAEQLVKITAKIKEFTEGLKISDETAAKIKSTFKGIFAGLDIGFSVIKSVISGVSNLIGHISGLGSGMLSVTGSFGDWVVNLRDSIKESDIFGRAVNKIASALGSAIDKVREFGSFIADHINFKEIGAMLQKVGSTIISGISAIGKTLGSALKNGNISSFLDVINKGTFGVILVSIARYIKGLADAVKSPAGIIDNIKSILGSVSDAIKDFQESIKIKNLKRISTALGILAAAIWVLASIDPGRLASSLGAITVLFGELLGSMKLFTMIDGGNTKSISKLANTMIKISAAVLILAFALKRIAGLSVSQLAKGLFGITILLGEMVAVAKVLSTDGSEKIRGGAMQMVIMAAALKILASACEDLGNLSWEQLAKGVVAIGALLSEFVGFEALMSKINPKKMISSALSLVIIGAAMEIFADAIGKLGMYSWEELAKGVSAIGVVLAEFAGFSGLLGLIGASAGSMIAASISLVVIGAAMEIFADVASKFGSMDWLGLGKAGAAITVILGICDAFLAIGLMGPGVLLASVALIGIGTAMEIFADVAKKFGDMNWEALGKAGAAVGGLLSLCAAFSTIGLMGPAVLLAAGSLLVMAVALRILTPVLTTLGGMSWGEIARGIVALASAFAVLAIGGAALGVLSPLLIAAGVGITLIGVGCLAAGAGVMMFAAGLTALAASAAAAGGSIRSIVEDFAAALPALLKGLGEGIVAMAEAIGNGGSALISAFTTILISIGESIINAAPTIVEAGVTVITSLLDGLMTVVPKAVEVGIALLKYILNGIRDNIGEITTTAIEIIVNFINGIGSKIGEVIQAGIDLAVSFINGVADGIRNNYETVNAAIVNLITACVEAATGRFDPFVELGKKAISKFTEGLSSAIGTVAETVGEVFSSIKGFFTGDVTEKQISKKFGGGSLQDFVNMVEKIKTMNLEKVKTDVQNFLNALSEVDVPDLSSLGDALAALRIPDLSEGVTQLQSLSELLSELVAIDTSRINSISDTLKSAGETIGNGFAHGIESSKGSVETAVKVLTTAASSAIKSDNKSFDQAGRESGVGFATGIGNAASSVTSAVKALVTAATNAIKQAENQFKSVGTKSAKAFATGITSAKAAVTAAAKSLASAATSALASVETAFKQAGRQAGAGFAAGLSSSVLSVRTAATALANAAKTAANAALEVNSPSRVFMRTGAYVALGLAKGITENSKWAENASVSMAVGIIKGVQKTLQINSPSKVMIEQGRYVVQGIAEGITEDMSPEEAAKKKAENIKSAFQEEFDKFDIEITISKNRFDLWSAQHPNASAAEVASEQIVYLKENIRQLCSETSAFAAQYNTLLETFGENYIETKRALADWQSHMKTLAETYNELNEAIEQQKMAPYNERIDELNESLDKLQNVQELTGLRFDMWDAQLNDTATSALKAARTITELSMNTDNLGQQAQVAFAMASAAAKQYGETSDEALDKAKAAYKLQAEYLSTQKDLANAQKDAEKVVASNYDYSRDMYNKYMKENSAGLMAAGYTYQDVMKLATEVTGFDPMKTKDVVIEEFRKSLIDMSENGIQSEIPIEIVIEPDIKIVNSNADTQLERLLTERVQNGIAPVGEVATQITDGKVKINDSLLTVAEALASQAETYQDVGQMLGESLVTGIQMGMAFTDGSGITRIIDFDELRARYQGPAEITLDGGGFNTNASYNAAVMATSPIEHNTEITVDNSEVVEAIDNLTGRVDMLGETVENLKVYLDTGVLVGQITPAVDRQLGVTATLRERG